MRRRNAFKTVLASSESIEWVDRGGRLERDIWRLTAFLPPHLAVDLSKPRGFAGKSISRQLT